MTGHLLNTVSEHFSDTRITHFCIEHCVVQVVLWPVQLKVSLDERGAISVNGVDVRYCLFLGCSRSDKSVDLRGTRSIEERSKNILAIAKKILRAPANDDAWAVRKCAIDRQFRNVGDSARIKQFQPIGWFSRLNKRISHREAGSFLRSVLANCTAPNPPPTITTLAGFTGLLL